MEIYFIDGTSEEFRFQSKKEAEQYLYNISELVNRSSDFDVAEISQMAIMADQFAGTLEETVDRFKETFSVLAEKSIFTPNGTVTSAPKRKRRGAQEEKVAKKCTSCGAPISGNSGKIVHCKYCDSQQQL
ncbi:hypothetical protein M2139_002170 [Enterococcus sp. PF1-24]|uniref:hypothetical protein n=1 Tax=unclassified Enterococcus TaxID=2608891 RepID=UPI002474EA68|nr:MULTISPECIES: hypothetical protein [unclassified Enterococcus]MDH6365146.1 hypothetical protein [Enterococcus sp. PFB1-1]MDH6402270.1 hypothetical protein [Enterococcus sp. PF1-24]